MASLEIDSKDVIRLMLQFMKENNLTNSMRELQTESDVTLNTVDNMEAFLSDIQKGHWDSVMAQVSSLKLPREKMVRLRVPQSSCSRGRISNSSAMIFITVILIVISAVICCISSKDRLINDDTICSSGNCKIAIIVITVTVIELIVLVLFLTHRSVYTNMWS